MMLDKFPSSWPELSDIVYGVFISIAGGFSAILMGVGVFRERFKELENDVEALNKLQPRIDLHGVLLENLKNDYSRIARDVCDQIKALGTRLERMEEDRLTVREKLASLPERADLDKLYDRLASRVELVANRIIKES